MARCVDGMALRCIIWLEFRYSDASREATRGGLLLAPVVLRILAEGGMRRLAQSVRGSKKMKGCVKHIGP